MMMKHLHQSNDGGAWKEDVHDEGSHEDGGAVGIDSAINEAEDHEHDRTPDRPRRGCTVDSYRRGHLSESVTIEFHQGATMIRTTCPSSSKEGRRLEAVVADLGGSSPSRGFFSKTRLSFNSEDPTRSVSTCAPESPATTHGTTMTMGRCGGRFFLSTESIAEEGSLEDSDEEYDPPIPEKEKPRRLSTIPDDEVKKSTKTNNFMRSSDPVLGSTNVARASGATAPCGTTAKQEATADATSSSTEEDDLDLEHHGFSPEISCRFARTAGVETVLSRPSCLHSQDDEELSLDQSQFFHCSTPQATGAFTLHNQDLTPHDHYTSSCSRSTIFDGTAFDGSRMSSSSKLSSSSRSSPSTTSTTIAQVSPDLIVEDLDEVSPVSAASASNNYRKSFHLQEHHDKNLGGTSGGNGGGRNGATQSASELLLSSSIELIPRRSGAGLKNTRNQKSFELPRTPSRTPIRLPATSSSVEVQSGQQILAVEEKRKRFRACSLSSHAVAICCGPSKVTSAPSLMKTA
ncbi:unnamed protein product [Amoebophrya sp. A25]|nr:unnamed protein product [Amoebophrya sp. A25]|eukprot:GSA25T00002553001.1